LTTLPSILDDHYLICAHLAAKQSYVIDLATNKVVATIGDTPCAEGVEYVPELHKFYTSNAYDNTIGVVDLKQMKVIKKLKTEAKPDGSTYAASFHKLYVSDERGKTEAIVDVNKDEIIKTLHFDSETGMPQYDPVAKKVCVNLQDQNIFAVIDPATDEVVGRYPVGRCKGNHGMTLDPEHHRAFLSCEENNLKTVFDLDKHEPIAFLPMDRTSSSSIRPRPDLCRLLQRQAGGANDCLRRRSSFNWGARFSHPSFLAHFRNVRCCNETEHSMG
jgi:DNA-binding beta-propeller fold protein YncE